MKDTNAWIFQTWVAAIISLIASVIGILGLEGTNLKLMGACLFACIYVSITLQKVIRDNQAEAKDTLAYRFVPWIGLAFALGFTYMSLNDLVEVDAWHKKYLIMSFLFVVSSVFVLTKTIRDGHEWERNKSKKDMM